MLLSGPRFARAVVFTLVLLLARSLSAQAAWGVQSVHSSGIKLGSPVGARVSKAGDLYVADLSSLGEMVIRKVSLTGRPLFEARIPGSRSSLHNMVLAGDGNVYISGHADGAVPVTAGAYLTSGDYFACGFSGSDGHLLFCTYVDSPDFHAFAVDTSGSIYIAAPGVPGPKGTILKLRPDGGLAYRIELNLRSPFQIAPGPQGKLLIGANGEYVLLELDAAGKVLHTSQQGTNGYIASMAYDSLGNPQVMTRSEYGDQPINVRRYSSDLATILFDSRVTGFEPIVMRMDASGGTLIAGYTSSVNFPLLRATGSCVLPALAQTYPFNGPNANLVIVRLDRNGNLIQSTFLGWQMEGAFFDAYVDTNGGWLALPDISTGQHIVTAIGPTPEVSLGCIGNAAALNLRPLAPEELVSIFGQGIGPNVPSASEARPGNRFPTQLAGVQVTFDGVPAPLFYASTNQINAAVPRSLSGRESTRICVLVNSTPSNCIEAPVRPASPGVFTIGRLTEYPYYSGFAAAVNQDGTVNSEAHPAPAGSVVSIYATGLGTITPALDDGEVVGMPLPSQDLPVGVNVITGVDKNTNSYRFAGLPVYYAGPAPFQTKGLTQINFKVPDTDALMFVTVGSSPSVQAATDLGFRLWIKRR